MEPLLMKEDYQLKTSALQLLAKFKPTTSDFEDDFGDAFEQEKGNHVLELHIIDKNNNINRIDNNYETSIKENIHIVKLIVSNKGIAKFPSKDDKVDESVETESLKKFILPIQIEGNKQTNRPSREDESVTSGGFNGDSEQDSVLLSATSDLGPSPTSLSLFSPHSQDGESLNFSIASGAFEKEKCLSPIKLEINSAERPVLRRQNTFTESACQTSSSEKSVSDKEKSSQTPIKTWESQISQTDEEEKGETFKSEDIGCQVDLGKAQDEINELKPQLNDGSSQTDAIEIDKNEQILKVPTFSEVDIQTEEISVISLSIQTDEYTDIFSEKSLLKSDADEHAATKLFAETQTDPKETNDTEIQTSRRSSPVTVVRSVTTTPSLCRNQTFVRESLVDEIVFRVLLEHIHEPDETKMGDLALADPPENAMANGLREMVALGTAGSDPGYPGDRSPSFVSVGNHWRSVSHNQTLDVEGDAKKAIDLSRSVNYLDLSRLGNEGETPNSDEMWVNVEDDNKFLTSDTETYSVATDKVSAMANFKGHLIGNNDVNNLMNSASETELADIGNDSILSDLDPHDASSTQLACLIRHEIKPVKEFLNTTGQTVTGIANTLYNIQDGINNICCNVTQMKCKVLSTGETDETVFPDNNKLELVKNGQVTGSSDELVDMVIKRLESALKRRDEQMQNAITSLREDNQHLRKEIEHYREKESQDGQRNIQLEEKMEKVLDHVNKLQQKKSNKSTSGSASDEGYTVDSKPKRAKRRSRSRTEINSKMKNNIQQNGLLRHPYPDDSSTEGEVEVPLPEQQSRLQSSVRIVEKQDTIDSIQQTEDFPIDTREIHIQTEPTAEMIEVSTNTEANSEANKPNESNSKEMISNDQSAEVKGDERKKRATERPLIKMETLDEGLGVSVIESGGSDKDEKNSKIESKTADINPGVKSTNPKKINNDKRKKDIEGKNKVNKNKPAKVKPLRRNSSVEKAPKPQSNKGLNNKLDKKKSKSENNIPEQAKGKDKRSKASKKPEEAANPSLEPNNAMMSKTIEGDDFKITITSNQELVSCELSDIEENQSPRKKIIVTPADRKDEKKITEKKETTEIKKGKIPISKQYIKQKAELPAPEQYPAARPPADQIPKPTLKHDSYMSSISSSMSPSAPMCYDYVGYNHNQPPTPVQQDYSICSNTYAISSGRNTRLSFMDGDVFTMMIKQDSRDSNLYDAPHCIPDLMDVRESPDGAYSYVIDGRIKSSMSNISDLKHDEEEASSDGTERDILMEFVLMEEAMEKNMLRPGDSSPFKGYAERVRHKIIKEYVTHGSRQKKPELQGSQQPPIKAMSVRRGQSRRLWRTRSKSLSNDKLSQITAQQEHNRKLLESRKKSSSTEKILMMTPAEEERIKRIKMYEDDTERLNENRRHYNMRKGRFLKQQSCPQGEVVIFAPERPQTVIEQSETVDQGEMAAQNSQSDHPSDSGVEVKETLSDNQSLRHSESSGRESSSKSQQSRPSSELKAARELDPLVTNNEHVRSKHRKLLAAGYAPLSVECFIVSRGWCIDQAQLTKAIAKLDGVNFVRVQVTNTMNRVVENIRPNNNIVLIHIGSQEISEACHSITNESSISGVAGSIASVFSRHIILACRTFRDTNFLISLPIPRRADEILEYSMTQESQGTSQPGEAGANACVPLYPQLRRAFNACLKANVRDYDNVILCSNENLCPSASETSQARVDSAKRFFTEDGLQLSSAGMRRLAKNWDLIIKRMVRTPDGQVFCRRSSDSSSLTSSGSSAGSTTSKASIIKREPWKPY